MSDSSDVPTFPPGFNLAKFAGVDYTLFGFMVDCILFGIAVGQAIYYYRAYAEDRRYIKIYVAFCMLLETAHFCSVAETLHFWMILCKMPENYANFLVFRATLLDSFFITGLLTILVHLFYAFRVWHLSQKNVYVTGLVVFLALVTYVFGNVLDGDQTIKKSTDTIHTHFSLIIYSINLSGAAVTDTVISVASIYYLHTRRTGFTSTENVIDRLIVFSANIGLVTSVNAVINLVLFVALPNSYSFLAWQLILGKLYVNSMLMTLNWRRNFRSTMENSSNHIGHSQSYAGYAHTSNIIAVDSEVETRRTRENNISLSTIQLARSRK